MSAKLLYSLSDENQNLQKQIGCMNGFLQFFERHHLITNRGTNSQIRRLTQGENSHQGREANGTNKRSKEKHQNAMTETPRNPTEPSRVSVSSSAGSTLSAVEYDQTTKPEQTRYEDTIFTDIHSQDSRTNRTFTSPNTSHRFQMKNVVVDSLSTCASPISTPKREQAVRHKHIDSPRLTQPSKLENPRLAVLNESFRSVNSNQSASITSLRRKDCPRMSYDGAETRETFVSGLRVGELPRLSLDSRQRSINKANNIQNLSEEPGSYRSPSNIVAKLMGLDALSGCSSSNQSQCGRLDSLSRSSTAIDESKLNRVLDSSRSKYRELRTPQLDNAGQVRESKQQNGHQEVDSEPGNHLVTVYGEIEKRLADIDFKKSGKDLRALKQILEAMHREKKAILERRNEIQSSSSGSQTSGGYSNSASQKQGPQKENRQHLHDTCTTPQRSKASRLPEDMNSQGSLKQGKLVKGSRSAAGRPSVRNAPSERIHGLRVGQPVNTSRASTENRTAKDPTPETNRCQYSAAISLKPLKNSKVHQHMAEANMTNSAKTSVSVSTKTRGSRTKHNHVSLRSHSQNKRLSQNPSELSTVSTCQKQQESKGNSSLSQIDTVITSDNQSPLNHCSLKQVSDDKHTEGLPTDGPFSELTISLDDQPSPVSVLDLTFYDDESPSPVKKKPTAFQDDESTETSNETEGKDADLKCSPYSGRPSFSYGATYQEQENFKQSAQITSEMNSNKSESITSPVHKKTNLEKAYVAEILLASGLLNNLNFINANHQVHQLKEVINPNLFFILEQTTASRFLSESKLNSKANTRTHDKHQRKLMFDAVNEIVSQKLAFTGFKSHPQPFSKRSTELKAGQQLLQDICKEINQLQVNSSNQSLDDEDDFLTTIIEKDLTHRSGNWTDSSSEASGLVLDIERLIFKDLIAELIHDEASHAQAQNQRQK